MGWARHNIPGFWSRRQRLVLSWGQTAVLYLLGLYLALVACRSPSSQELLIGIKSDSLSLLLPADELRPEHTGVASLDKLNAKWGVLELSSVFPDIAPDDEAAARQGLQGVLKLVVPGDTDLQAMIAEYESDPHVDYVEVNKPVEIE